MKKTSSILIMSAVLFLFSCASTPTEDSNPAEQTAATETEETSAEEKPQAEKTEETEDPAVDISQTEEAEVEQILEPIESDIIGWYESDPAEVVLSPMASEIPQIIEEEEVKDEPAIKQIPVVENEHILEESENRKKIAEITDSVDEVKKDVEEIKADIKEIKADKKENKADAADIKIEKKEKTAETVKTETAETVKTETVKTETAKTETAKTETVKTEPKISVREEKEEKKDSNENGTTVALGADIPAESEEKEEITEPVIVPSRKVTMLNNQYLDIEYPGNGWIYLGEKDDAKHMRYFGRKLGTENTLFSLRSREEGSTILHFYKNDALTGHYIDDYLEVEIKGTSTTSKRVTAPRYAEIVPSRPEKKTFINAEEEIKIAKKFEEEKKKEEESKEVPRQKKTAEKKQTERTASAQKSSTTKVPQPQQTEDDNGDRTVIQTTEIKESAQSNPVSDDSEVIQPASPVEQNETASKTKVQIQDTKDMMSDKILELAQEAYNKKEYASSLAYLDDFFEKATTRIDEGLYLQGQNFESASEVRNIKAALDTYETIVRKYPQSINWAKANARVTYLKKFYFNIR